MHERISQMNLLLIGRMVVWTGLVFLFIAAPLAAAYADRKPHSKRYHWIVVAVSVGFATILGGSEILAHIGH